MSDEIKNAFEYALLARAAYSNLEGGDVTQKLKDSGWPPALATYFNNN